MAKTKIQITMDENLLNDLDDYCDKNYMNRSWAISQCVVEKINAQKMLDCFVKLTTLMKQCVENGEIDEKTKNELEYLQTMLSLVNQYK